MKIMAGFFSLAKENNYLINLIINIKNKYSGFFFHKNNSLVFYYFSLSPTYFEIKSDEDMLKKVP
jgi:hypothetical protein